ncbi:MAG TPA: HAD family hydrolase [Mucilaginibacter sp.]|jgi:D-glycero-D-manno-heptose 1,7-bisphosphate phosphatase
MKKALFLDRDGIINIDKGYVYKIEDFVFTDFIFELALQYQQKGYLIIVITNQAGIARGYYTIEDFNVLTNWMIKKFHERGIYVTKVYFCPHHPDFTGVCRCRKPNTGMILDAKREFDIDLKKSILIGDKESDIEAGRRAEIGELILRKH